MKNNILNEVITELSEYFNMNKSDLNENTELSAFNMDSLDIAQIVTNLEEKFNIDFTFDIVKNIKSIKDICNYIESEIG